MSMFPLEVTSNGVCGATALPEPVADRSDSPSTFPAVLPVCASCGGTNTTQHKQAQSRVQPESGPGVCRAQEVTKTGFQVPRKGTDG